VFEINNLSNEDEIRGAILQAIIGLMQQEHGLKLTLSVHQAADALGVNHLKIYDLCRTAGFPSIKFGNRIVIPVIQFLEWIDKESWGSSSEGL